VIPEYHEVEGDYVTFSKQWIDQLPRIMKDTASAYIFSGYTHLKSVLDAIDHAGLILKNHIIWKYQFGPFTTRKYVSSHYHVLFVVKHPQKYFFHRIEHYNLDVWDEITRTYKAHEKKNGTKLPVELVQKCIDFGTKPGDLVFDPFMGNGTTAVTAKMNFRHFFGFEINKNMRPIIEYNLNNAQTGEMYVPYQDRIPPPEKLAKIDSTYARAYEEYLRNQDDTN
jgi:site-specific DNA-methyltransferase (adenine-specific)